jgi:hypothetical protein
MSRPLIPDELYHFTCLYHWPTIWDDGQLQVRDPGLRRARCVSLNLSIPRSGRVSGFLAARLGRPTPSGNFYGWRLPGCQ